MEKEKILISAGVLKWARKTLYGGNLAEPASKLKVSVEVLTKWESGGAEISTSQLKKISPMQEEAPVRPRHNASKKMFRHSLLMKLFQHWVS